MYTVYYQMDIIDSPGSDPEVLWNIDKYKRTWGVLLNEHVWYNIIIILVQTQNKRSYSMTIIFLCQKINAFRVTNNFAYIFAQSRAVSFKIQPFVSHAIKDIF